MLRKIREYCSFLVDREADACGHLGASGAQAAEVGSKRVREAVERVASLEH